MKYNLFVIGCSSAILFYFFVACVLRSSALREQAAKEIEREMGL